MNFATESVAHLITVCKTVSSLSTKVFDVYTAEELSDKVNVIKLPAVGVVYEGMRSVGNDQLGKSAELVCSILLLAEKPKAMGLISTKDSSLELLDSIRHAILGSRAPTGHFWKFQVESPAADLNSQIVWLQRWATPVQVVSTP